MIDLNDLATVVVGRLMLIQPANWSSLTLRSRRDGPDRRVTRIEGRVDPDYPTVRFEWCDRDAQHALLERDLTALHMRACLTARGWNGELLVLVRPASGPIRVHAYNGPDEEPAFTCTVRPSQLATGVPLLAAIEGCVDDMTDRLRHFYDRLGPYRAQRTDLSAGLYRFEVPGGELSFPMTAIGSYHHARGQWRWSWAVPSFVEHRAVSAPMRLLRTAPAGGMAVFQQAVVDTDATFAGWLALLAAHRIGGLVHRVERPGVTTYFALGDTEGRLEDPCVTRHSLPA